MKKIVILHLLFLLYIGLVAQTRIEKTNSEWHQFKHQGSYTNLDIEKIKERLNLENDDELRIQHSYRDRLNYLHETYQQHYKGLPVEGTAVKVHEKEGHVHINGDVIKGISTSIIPNISEFVARNIAIQHIGGESYAWEIPEMEEMIKEIENNPKASFLPKGNLVIFSSTLDGSTARLAYEFEIYVLVPHQKVKLYIDAHTSEILFEIGMIHHCSSEPCSVDGNGETRYNGMQNISCSHNEEATGFNLKTSLPRNIDTRNKNSQISFPLGEPFENDSICWGSADPDAIAVHWATERTYDYFKNVHGRNSYNNQNGKIISLVHYGNAMDGAFWNGVWISYGDGANGNGSWTSLDMVAHEISHAFIQSMAGLIYLGESGALNESFADIFAVSIEYDVLGDTGFNWTIGENITGDSIGLRNMAKPMYYKGDDWHYGSSDYGGVHTNSGVQNYWFYLLAEAIGMEKAAKICFYSLNNYLTPYSNYADARNASIQAASILYGQDIADIVCDKWIVVGVSDNCGNNDTITISNPVELDTLFIGNTLDLNWTASEGIDFVKIEYKKTNDFEWQVIEDYLLNTESYLWGIPESLIQSQISIKVSDATNHGINDILDTLFVEECPVITSILGNDHACLGEEVIFNSNSINASNHEWLINGEVIGTDSIFFWNADIGGEQELELRAYGASGCYDSFLQNVFVSDTTNEVAIFDYQNVGDLFTFSVSNFDSGADYIWSFGDGNTGEGNEIEHTYDNQGFFTVCLMVDNECGTFQYSKNVIVLPSGGNGGLCSDEWHQYSNGEDIVDLADGGDCIWIGTTRAGLVKLSKSDGSTTFYNSSNSELPSNFIRTLLADEAGHIWIGTYGGGVVEFDGTNWNIFKNTNSPLTSNNISSILEDKDGIIWVGANNGDIVKYDGADWNSFDKSGSTLGNASITVLLEDIHHDIWIGTDDGVVNKFDGGTFEILSPNLNGHEITSLLEDSSDNIWLSSDGGGLAKFNGGNWEYFNTSNQYLPEDRISFIMENTPGVFLVGTHSMGILEFDGTNSTTFAMSNLGLPHNNVNAIVKDSDSQFWIGTYRGLAKFDGQTNIESIVTSNSGLPSNSITCLLEDASGNIWIGAKTHGLTRFNGTDWDVFNKSNTPLLLDNHIVTLLEDGDDNIWIVTDEGNVVMYVTNDDAITTIPNLVLSNTKAVSLLNDSDNNVWIGTDNGNLIRYTEGETPSFYSIPTGTVSSLITAFLEDDNGDIWIGTNSGILKYTDGTITSFNTPLDDKYITAFLKDNNDNIWAGTKRDGIGKLIKDDSGGTDWEIYNLSNSVLPSNNITSLLQDKDGNVWAGTDYKGVVRFDDLEVEFYITPNSGLPMNLVTALLQDSLGNIWIGTKTAGIGINNLSIRPKFKATVSCAGDTSFFQNISQAPIHNEWQINGETVSYEEDLNYYFASSGAYEVSLIANSNDGCSDVYQELVVVPAAATELDHYLPEYVSICRDNSTTIDIGEEKYDSYKWISEEGMVLTNTSELLVNETGLYYLEVVDFCGASAMDSITVILGNDCVWPGDTNKDGIVNHYDLLSIGLKYDLDGNPRLGANMDFVGQAMTPWDTLVQTQTGGYVDTKHNDTNGDGNINVLDVDAIHLNYGKYYKRTTTPESETINAPYTLVPVFKGIDSVTQELQIEVELQVDEGMQIPFYGLGFSLLYESPSSFDTIPRPMFLHSNTIGENVISLHRQFGNRTDVALVGTNHQNWGFQSQGAAAGSMSYPMVVVAIGDEKELSGGDSLRYMSIKPEGALAVNNVGDSIPIKSKQVDLYLLDENLSFVLETHPFSCDSIGSAKVIPINTLKSYSYLWSTGDTTQSIINIPTGSYTVSIRENGSGLIVCESTIDIVGLESLELRIEEVNTEEGIMLKAIANGGDGNYKYYWNESEESSQYIPLKDNQNYRVKAIDGTDCSIIFSFFSLPVELLEFFGYPSDNHTILKWATATEENSSAFIVEHSTDGYSFEDIGKVSAAGFSTVEQSYEFIHEKPIIGTNYYRLRMQDLDGTEDFSEIKAIGFKDKGGAGFSIFPNPNKGEHLFFSYEAEQDEEVNIEVTDNLGRIVLVHQENALKGTNLFDIDIKSLPNGIYFIQLDVAENMSSQRFLIFD